MRVMITGATGFIGRHLTTALLSRGDDVVALSRFPQSPDRRGVVWRTWDAVQAGEWTAELARCDAVVHLAGEPIGGGRWTESRKDRIRHSRMASTQTVSDAILAASPRPKTLISASGAGFYGPRDASPVDETGRPGSDFLAVVCRDWEMAAIPVRAEGIRLVQLRIGPVLATDGGALPKILPAFRLGLGGRLGDGGQGFPWVHRDDLVALILWALAERAVSGPLNATAPQPVSNAAFTRTLNQILSRPGFLPVPAWALRLACGEMADVLLAGAYVLPRKALELGFHFQFPDLEGALRAILAPGGNG